MKLGVRGSLSSSQIAGVIGTPSRADLWYVADSHVDAIIEHVTLARSGRFRASDAVPSFGALSADCVDFISSCLVWNPDTRMSVSAALVHPFVTSAYARDVVARRSAVYLEHSRSDSVFQWPRPLPLLLSHLSSHTHTTTITTTTTTTTTTTPSTATNTPPPPHTHLPSVSFHPPPQGRSLYGLGKGVVCVFCDTDEVVGGAATSSRPPSPYLSDVVKALPPPTVHHYHHYHAAAVDGGALMTPRQVSPRSPPSASFSLVVPPSRVQAARSIGRRSTSSGGRTSRRQGRRSSSASRRPRQAPVTSSARSSHAHVASMPFAAAGVPARSASQTRRRGARAAGLALDVVVQEVVFHSGALDAAGLRVCSASSVSASVSVTQRTAGGVGRKYGQVTASTPWVDASPFLLANRHAPQVPSVSRAFRLRHAMQLFLGSAARKPTRKSRGTGTALTLRVEVYGRVACSCKPVPDTAVLGHVDVAVPRAMSGTTDGW